jgi:hypothetical protein
MMEGFGQLLAFSLVMLFGSYMAGSLPLFMSMSEKNLHLVSVLGAGLLLGVALAVIIPEGLQTLIKAYSTSPSELGEICSFSHSKLSTTETPGRIRSHELPSGDATCLCRNVIFVIFVTINFLDLGT